MTMRLCQSRAAVKYSLANIRAAVEYSLAKIRAAVKYRLAKIRAAVHLQLANIQNRAADCVQSKLSPQSAEHNACQWKSKHIG